MGAMDDALERSGKTDAIRDATEPHFTFRASDPNAPALLRVAANRLRMDIDCGARSADLTPLVEKLFLSADHMEAWRDGTPSILDPVKPVAILPALQNISKHVLWSAVRSGYRPSRTVSLGALQMNEPELLASLILIRNDIHGRNRAAGWWNNLTTGQPLKRDPRELAMLVVTEFAEAMEGFRKGLKDDKLPHRSMLEVELADAIIRMFDMFGGCEINFIPAIAGDLNPFCGDGETVPSGLLRCCREVAGMDSHSGGPAKALSFALFGTFLLGEMHGLDVPGAIIEKLEYNASRADHKPENRRKEGGKKL